tara:strand:+ start:258 stop:434 length:177 start_codon:yes stop_codon:yes gene_type:complete
MSRQLSEEERRMKDHIYMVKIINRKNMEKRNAVNVKNDSLSSTFSNDVEENVIRNKNK